MAKWYTKSQKIGRRGEALVKRRVLDMGFLYNETSMDAGIDGDIEIADPSTGEATNRVVRVQSKATSNPFPGETDSGFTYTCSQNDLDYWLSGNVPVILVCSRPDTDEAYWVPVKDYFSSPERKSSRKIEFDKETDRFDESAVTRLIDLAAAQGGGLYISPVPKPERLISNLLEVVHIARRLYSADTELFKRGQVLAEAEKAGVWLPREWILWRGRIWSIHNLGKPPWTSFCDNGTIEKGDLSEWAESDDPDLQRQFVHLLNQCASALLLKQGVRYDRAMRHYHFMAPEDKQEFSVGYTTHKGRSSSITVFSVYTYDKADGTEGRSYRHHAFEGRFVRFESRWFMRIDPTYRYTWDGRNVDTYYESKLSKIRRIEKNRAVLSQVELWAEVLRNRVDLIRRNHYPHLQFGRLLEFEIDHGIEDEEWGRVEKEEKEKIISVVAPERTLFDDLSSN